MCLSVCLSVCLSIYLYVYLSVCLSICLSVYLSIYLSVCLSFYSSINPSIRLTRYVYCLQDQIGALMIPGVWLAKLTLASHWTTTTTPSPVFWLSKALPFTTSTREVWSSCTSGRTSSEFWGMHCATWLPPPSPPGFVTGTNPTRYMWRTAVPLNELPGAYLINAIRPHS